MKTLLQQLKKRRLDLGLKQNDMMLRVGVSRQQYQRLESKGNPRLATLELITKGLNSEIMLIPREKLSAVLAALEEHPRADDQGDSGVSSRAPSRHIKDASRSKGKKEKNLSDDPWQGLLGDDS